jgi:peptide chain release factor 3
VDAAVMVVDAGKGIESQTRKLFEVCRMRGVPIFTFINKMDRPSKRPLDLLDELENVLGIHAMPVNWPLGDGPEFKGVFDREKHEVHLFERTPGGAYRAPEEVSGIQDEAVKARLAPDVYARVCEELELLDGAGADFDQDAVRAGTLTPVFFGSAMNNFGVELLLNRFLEMAPAPSARNGGTRMVDPAETDFSGFVFKIQANMNPKHRDRVAFIRVVSGEFRRDMVIPHPHTGRPVRLSNAQRLFARDRETVDTAWAGDVVGLVGNHEFRIGDTLSEKPGIHFAEIPHFAPECFANLFSTTSATQKRFREGLEQLLREGVAQLFELKDSLVRTSLLGAVGPLQFEVLIHRLENEYGAGVRMEAASWKAVRWISQKDGTPFDSAPTISLPSGTALGRDATGHWVVFFPGDWALSYFAEKNPDLTISSTRSAADDPQD